jgi:heme oxygenase
MMPFLDNNEAALSPASPCPSVPHLGDAINIGTRSTHTKLNKLILQRLPLALPPLSPNPSAYVSGLLHIAPIYITFETLWQNILEPHQTQHAEDISADCEPGAPLAGSESVAPSRKRNDGDPLGDAPGLVSDRVQGILSRVHLQGLGRSSSLRSDIAAMTGWPEHTVEEQIRSVSQTGALKDFIEHMQQSVQRNPHVLLAYAWVLYMALFSGGRYVRASLEAAGYDFWNKACDGVPDVAVEQPISVPAAPFPFFSMIISARQTPTSSVASVAGSRAESQASILSCLPLGFFRFQTACDGEDLKTDFKERLVEVETLLTSSEREHVVQEAQHIFDFMIKLVEQLDDVVGSATSQGTGNIKASSPPAFALSAVTTTAGLTNTTAHSEPALTSPTSTFMGAISEAWAHLLMPRAGGRLRDSVDVYKERLDNQEHECQVKQQDSAEEVLHERDREHPRLERSRSSTTTSATSITVSGVVTPAAELASLVTPPVPSHATRRSVHFETLAKTVVHGQPGRDESSAPGCVVGSIGGTGSTTTTDGAADDYDVAGSSGGLISAGTAARFLRKRAQDYAFIWGRPGNLSLLGALVVVSVGFVYARHY